MVAVDAAIIEVLSCNNVSMRYIFKPAFNHLLSNPDLLSNPGQQLPFLPYDDLTTTGLFASLRPAWRICAVDPVDPKNDN
jgi:hypothetical protein